MILILDFDLDSGLQDINGNLLKSSVYGCFWIIVPDNKKMNLSKLGILEDLAFQIEFMKL